LAIVIVIYVVIKGQYQYLEIIPGYIFFGANFIVDHIPTLSITWSLSVEEQYYLLWPVILLILPSRWLVPGLLVMIATNVGLMLLELSRGTPVGIRTEHYFFRLPNSTYAPILLGSLLAVWLDRRWGYRTLRSLVGYNGAPGLLLLSLAVTLLLLPTDLRGWPNLCVHLLMMLTLASIVVREDNHLAWFLQNGLVSRIGEISYGVYLYHLLAEHVTRTFLSRVGLDSSTWLHLLIYVGISLMLAELSFRYYESRFLQKRIHFSPVGVRPAVGG